MTPCYSQRLDQALAFAADCFRGTRRKGTMIPYLSHLLQVCVYVAENGGDEDQMIAAVLHDYLEDVEGASAGELERRFGLRVRELVEALSDSHTHPKPPWEQRKCAYLERLRVESASVKLISACDKLHNAQCILRDLRNEGASLWDRFSGGRDGTLWYYRAVVGALAEGFDHVQVGRLREVVADLHAECGSHWPERE